MVTYYHGQLAVDSKSPILRRVVKLSRVSRNFMYTRGGFRGARQGVRLPLPYFLQSLVFFLLFFFLQSLCKTTNCVILVRSWTDH